MEACAASSARADWSLLSQARATFAATAKVAIRTTAGKEETSRSTWGAPPNARLSDYSFRPEQPSEAQAIARVWTRLDQAMAIFVKVLNDEQAPLVSLEAEVEAVYTSEYFGKI